MMKLHALFRCEHHWVHLFHRHSSKTIIWSQRNFVAQIWCVARTCIDKRHVLQSFDPFLRINLLISIKKIKSNYDVTWWQDHFRIDALFPWEKFRIARYNMFSFLAFLDWKTVYTETTLNTYFTASNTWR